MIENLKRIREPLAWAVIALMVANMVLGIVELVLQVQQAVPLFEAFQSIGGSLLNISLVVALVALVCLCFFIAPATRHAHAVTLVAAWVLSVGVVLTLCSYALGAAAADDAFGRILEIFGGLLDLLLKALAAGSLWVLLRGVRAGRIDVAAPAPSTVDEPAPDEDEADPALPRTTWQRGEATGAVWRTADDAAAGTPGAARLPEELSTLFRDEPNRSSDGQEPSRPPLG
ncbi:MAG: hypothetical protein QM779_08435 [Propionicimonas sp.]|uniref:hypothetical protein n=1 Tax=Propionicimonas sp. TaxID=1955623 RepID=UPI003D1181A6